MKVVFGKLGLACMFCLMSYAIFAQDTEKQELRYFSSDNAFYLGNKRLFDSEVEMILSKNLSALEAWKRGNSFKAANTAMKITTGVLIPVGGILMVVGFIQVAAEATVAISLAPLSAISGTPLPSNDNNVNGCFVAGITLFSAGIITGIMIPITKSNSQFHYSDAADIYNKSKSTVSLHIGITGNGIGFNVKF